MYQPIDMRNNMYLNIIFQNIYAGYFRYFHLVHNTNNILFYFTEENYSSQFTFLNAFRVD